MQPMTTWPGRRSALALALALLLLPLLPSRPSAEQEVAPPLQEEAERIVGRVGGDWGIMAWSIDRNRPLILIHPNDVRTPASNNKVFTSIWAFGVLGQDYRFPTDLLVTGPIENGVLKGDVVIRGSGDPAFGYTTWTKDPMEPLRIMAQQLRDRGVREVQGAVVGDPSIFDTVLVGPKWPRDTGGGSAAYAPRVSGLPMQRNLLAISARPNPRGGAAIIELEPDVGNLIPVTSTVRTGGGRAWAVREADSDTIQVKGAVTGRYAHIYRIGVTEPALMTTGALRAAITAAGITVHGPARIGRTPEDAVLVHRHYSIPLSVMIHKMNTESDNFFAEHLWKAAAAKELGQGSYVRGGPASALFFMRRARVPLGQLYQYDGSGLSEYDRITPNAMVRALVYANAAPFSEAFHHSLAVAGDREGTLRNMFRTAPTKGNLHAKTGYINGVRTLSGYVRARNGELIAFSFLYNGRGTSAARGVQVELGDLLANYGAPAATTAKETDGKPAAGQPSKPAAPRPGARRARSGGSRTR
jgi:D-alanyl-D-alanine carboxypeptidase/D-alanyl-D-alanine-endopeptidase (penicillin-binding protein 4)